MQLNKTEPRQSLSALFVVGGGATSKRSRPLLHCRLKKDRGKIHSFEKHGHIAHRYLGVPGCERGMLLDHDVKKNDDKNDLSRKERGQRSLCLDGIVSGIGLHDPYGRTYHLTKKCPTLAGSRVIKEIMVCQQCENLQSSVAQDGHRTCRTARSAPVM